MMTTETKRGTKGHFDVTELAKVWKENYLKGLEASLQWQERNEHFIIETVRQGLAVPHNWFTASQSLFGKPGEEPHGQTTGMPNQFVAFTRDILQNSQNMAEPVLKTAADACETTFNYYETVVAGPSRKFALEINKKVLDTVIPD